MERLRTVHVSPGAIDRAASMTEVLKLSDVTAFDVRAAAIGVIGRCAPRAVLPPMYQWFSWSTALLASANTASIGITRAESPNRPIVGSFKGKVESFNLTHVRPNLTDTEHNLTHVRLNLADTEPNQADTRLNLTNTENNQADVRLNLTDTEHNLTDVRRNLTDVPCNKALAQLAV